MRAELISVGTELLLGQIVDTNSAYLSGRLAMLGIDCLHQTTVGDNLGRATEAFQRALARSELIVATGGLGPTEDDLTREAIAAALGETPAVDATLEADLREWFGARGQRMPGTNLKQAWLIASARPLPNPLGTAPGWDLRHDGRRVVAMPGVPREMTRMWEEEVEPTLFPDAVLRSRTLKLLGMGESAVEEALGALVRSTAPTVATYAKNDGVHVRITDKGQQAADVDERIAAMEAHVRERVGAHVWGVDGETIGGAVARALTARGWSLATAESLTGGELARTLIESGAGDRYAGGVVRPAADVAALSELLGTIRADVVVFTPELEDGRAAIVVRVGGRDRRVEIPYRTLAEARRRAVLGALDLLRRL